MPIYKMQGKRDGLQKYRVRINYTDKDGKAHQLDRIAYGNDAAKNLERELMLDLDKTSKPRGMTIEKLYDDYIEHKQYEVRATTLDKTKRCLQYHILPILKDYKIDNLSNSILKKWKLSIEEKKLKISTKKYIHKELNAMMNYAVRMEYIPYNPLRNIGNFKDPYVSAEKETLHYYTPEQFLNFIKIAYESAHTLTDWGYYVFFNIAFYTGMRKGEINALKWSDIEENIIHIRRSIAQKLKGEDIETPPKNKSSYRDLQMPVPLIKILEEHKKRQMSSSEFTEEFRVCGGIKCLRDTSIENKNKQFSDAAKLPHIRIHDFRHSHASVLVNEGINIQEIARRLGHSDIQITWNTYAHLYPREEERAISVLNKINLFV